MKKYTVAFSLMRTISGAMSINASLIADATSQAEELLESGDFEEIADLDDSFAPDEVDFIRAEEEPD